MIIVLIRHCHLIRHIEPTYLFIIGRTIDLAAKVHLPQYLLALLVNILIPLRLPDLLIIIVHLQLVLIALSIIIILPLHIILLLFHGVFICILIIGDFHHVAVDHLFYNTVFLVLELINKVYIRGGPVSIGHGLFISECHLFFQGFLPIADILENLLLLMLGLMPLFGVLRGLSLFLSILLSQDQFILIFNV